MSPSARAMLTRARRADEGFMQQDAGSTAGQVAHGPWASVRWRGLLVLLLMLPPMLSAATGPNLQPTPRWLPSVLHEADDGLPSSRVTALAQDHGGWLWVGTSEGLVRWDGLRFERHAPEVGMPMPVSVLAVSGDDAVWVAVEGAGLWRLSPDRLGWQHFHREAPAPARLPADEVFALHEHAGAMWVGTYAAGLARIVDGVVQSLPAYPVAPDWSPTLLIGVGEALYAGTVSAGLQRLSGVDGAPQTLATGRVMHAGALMGDALMIAPSRQDLLRLSEAGVSRLPLPRLQGTAPAIYKLGLREDGLWLATDRGVLQQTEGQWRWYASGAQHGLPDGRVVDLLVDREQNLWLAVEGQGLVRIDPPGTPQTVWLGGHARRAEGAERSADGSLLVAFRDGGLARLDPAGALTWIGPSDAGIPFAVLEHAGTWWLGHDEGLSRTPVGQVDGWRPVPAVHGATELVDLLLPLPGGGVVASLYGSAVHALDAEGQLLGRWAIGEALAGPEVEALALDDSGGLWIAHARGLCRIAAPQSGGECRAVGELTGQRVRALSPLGDGVLAATAEQLWQVTPAGELRADRPLAGIDGALAHGLHASVDGRRWISTGRGLLVLEADGSHRWQGTAEGFPTRELAERPFQVRDGQLLIGSERGLIVRQLDAPPASAGVPGEWRVHAAGAPWSASYAHGAPRPRLSLHAARLAEAGRARYRYRLDGPLPQAGEVIGALQLDLSTLPPGDWRLELSSSAAAAPWSGAFRIAPPWWQTWAFQGSLLLLGAGLLGVMLRAWRRRLLLEQRLRLERAQAEWGERLAAEKTEFVATLSHELRNQLQGVNASIALMRLSKAESLPAVFDRAEAAVKAMAGLLNDALQLSRLEGGRLPLQPEVVRLAALGVEVDGALDTLRPQWPAVSGQLHWRAPRVSVELDPLRFRQILLNLAGNAWRHARHRVEVDVELDRASDGSRAAQLRMAVRDDGPGIPDELRERLFGRWQRAHRAGGEGSGLGLAICRQLVESMGGTISVQSQPGHTQFDVSLPVTVIENENDALEQADPLLLLGEAAELAGLGMELLACDSPLALLGSLESHPRLSAVLVAADRELAMRPLLPLLRSRRPGLPILLLATSVMPADLARAREQGYDGLLGLPLTRAALTAALRGS